MRVLKDAEAEPNVLQHSSYKTSRPESKPLHVPIAIYMDSAELGIILNPLGCDVTAAFEGRAVPTGVCVFARARTCVCVYVDMCVCAPL